MESRKQFAYLLRSYPPFVDSGGAHASAAGPRDLHDWRPPRTTRRPARPPITCGGSLQRAGARTGRRPPTPRKLAQGVTAKVGCAG